MAQGALVLAPAPSTHEPEGGTKEGKGVKIRRVSISDKRDAANSKLLTDSDQGGPGDKKKSNVRKTHIQEEKKNIHFDDESQRPRSATVSGSDFGSPSKHLRRESQQHAVDWLVASPDDKGLRNKVKSYSLCVAASPDTSKHLAVPPKPNHFGDKKSATSHKVDSIDKVAFRKLQGHLDCREKIRMDP